MPGAVGTVRPRADHPSGRRRQRFAGRKHQGRSGLGARAAGGTDEQCRSASVGWGGAPQSRRRHRALLRGLPRRGPRRFTGCAVRPPSGWWTLVRYVANGSYPPGGVTGASLRCRRGWSGCSRIVPRCGRGSWSYEPTRSPRAVLGPRPEGLLRPCICQACGRQPNGAGHLAPRVSSNDHKENRGRRAGSRGATQGRRVGAGVRAGDSHDLLGSTHALSRQMPPILQSWSASAAAAES